MRMIIEQLIGEALTRRIPETVPRDVCVRRMPGKVSVLTGMRRTGKTSLCFQAMRSLHPAEAHGVWHHIQVCWSLTESATAAREFRGIADAPPLHPKARRTVVT